MSDYTFCVSLSITHPSITPDEISAALNIIPSHSYKTGEQRVNPKGKVLEGKHKRNFWRFTPHSAPRLSAEDVLLEDYLLSLNKEYEQHKEYFSKVVSTGGHIEYFIGWFNGEYNLMATLSPELLRTMMWPNDFVHLDGVKYTSMTQGTDHEKTPNLYT